MNKVLAALIAGLFAAGAFAQAAAPAAAAAPAPAAAAAPAAKAAPAADAKAEEARAQKDLKNLDFVETETGTKHAREMEKQAGQARGNQQLEVTKVIVAHRPETIASADRVLVMHGGRIVQEVRPEPVQVAA